MFEINYLIRGDNLTQLQCLWHIISWAVSRFSVSEWVLETAGVSRSYETGILWAYVEKERVLPGEGINTRNNPRLPYSR